MPCCGMMIASVFWGANFMVLLEMTAGGFPSRNKQVHPLMALNTRKNIEHVTEENGQAAAKAAVDPVSRADRLRQLATPGSFLRASLSQEEDAIEESPGEDRNGLVGAHDQRVLQSCAVGDSVTITSSAFPRMEGCLSDMGFVMDDKVVYESTTAALASVGPSASTTTDTSDALWFALEIEDGEADFRCFSTESSLTLAHPATATWICDVDGNGDFITPTSSQFSTTCGCSTSTTGDAPAASTCDDGESFTITSSVLPDVAGCYSDTGIDVESAALYSETGTDNLQQIFVYSFDVGSSGSPDVRWIVIYEVSSSTTTAEGNLYCYSGDHPTHPVDVTSWYCFTGSGDEEELVSSAQFSVSCGCSSTAPSPTPSATLEPAPVETPSPEVVLTPEATPETTLAPVTPDTPEPTPEATPETALAPVTPDTPEPTLEATPETTPEPAMTEPSPAPVVSSTHDPVTAEPTIQTEPPLTVPTVTPITAAPQTDETTMVPTTAAIVDLTPTTPSPAAIIPSSSPSPVVSITSQPSAASRGISSSGSPSPTSTGTTPTATMIPSPVVGTKYPAPTANNTCNGEFQLTSSSAPVLEGCFDIDVVETFSGEEVYARIGDGESVGTVVIAANTSETRDPSLLWVLVYLATNTSTDAIVYCISGESADEVHPADATWLCDLNDASSDFTEVTPMELDLACDCSEEEGQEADRGSLSAFMSIFITAGLAFAATVVLLAEI